MIAFNEPLHVVFGFMVDELEDFKEFNLTLDMLSTIVNAANSTQNCPKLPKFANKDETLKYHQKSRF
jgi:hypothetical protein